MSNKKIKNCINCNMFDLALCYCYWWSKKIDYPKYTLCDSWEEGYWCAGGGFDEFGPSDSSQEREEKKLL